MNNVTLSYNNNKNNKNLETENTYGNANVKERKASFFETNI